MITQSMKQRGFTLIELLVVIAIIGILASVVLASLNSAREKGADAAIKSTINNVRAQAELFYDDNTPNSYTGLCATLTDAAAAVNNAGGTGTWTCNEATAGASYAASGLLNDGTTYYCVDSTGYSGEQGSAAASGLCN